MRFVQIKSAEQQGRLMLHRTRDLLMRQRTQVINALRAHLAELGIASAQGREGLKELLKIVASDADERLPADARASLVMLAAELRAMQTLIGLIEKRIVTQHRENKASKRLRTIPGIGIIGATAIADTVTDPKAFRSGRDFAAWIGLVPRQNSTGGKQKLGTNLETGRSLFAAHSRCRRALCPAARKAEPAETSLAHAALGAAAVQGRGGRAGQQNGAHGMGVAGQGRRLSGACARSNGLRSLATGG